jgi:Spy/CpxP family protein refolding chaperone
MKRSHLAAFCLAVAVTATASAEEAEPKRILDFELRRLERVAEKFELPAEKLAALKAVATEHDAARRSQLEALAGELVALDEAVDSGADPLPALEALDTRRKAMRATRVARMDALGAVFSDHQKLKIVAKMHDRRHKHRKGRMGKFFRKHISTLMVKVLGIDQATFDTTKDYVQSRKPLREALKSEFEGIRNEVKEYLDAGEEDPAKATLLVARLKDFREKIHEHTDEGFAGAKEVLTPAQRAELTTKVVAGVRKLMGFATYFWDVEEMKLFL